MRPVLIPFKSVGKILLNSSINNYTSLFSFDVDCFDELSAPSINYSMNKSEITLFVINGIIDSIACYKKLYFNNKNLLDLTVKDLMAFTNQKYYGKVDELNFDEDNIPQYVYEFEKIGLQVWEKGKNGRIVTIIVNGAKHYI